MMIKIRELEIEANQPPLDIKYLTTLEEKEDYQSFLFHEINDLSCGQMSAAFNLSN